MRSGAYNAVVCDSEVDALFACLADFDHVVLAVSGGPDSMALMVLAAEWEKRRGFTPPRISVATVDHGLRPEAAEEAKLVEREARRLGLSHAVLKWSAEKPQSGIAAAARNARYRLLKEHALSIGVARVAIVTAHQREDQAETFAMRLARGSGVEGLAAMRAVRPLRGGSCILLVRPLLNVSRARLVATLEARGVASVDDPTNRDARCERVRVRNRTLPALAEAGIDVAAIATSARRLGEAADALHYAEKCFNASLGLSLGHDVFATFDRRAFNAGPAYLRQRVMGWLIARFGGATREPQLVEVEELVARLQHNDTSRSTLGGVTISGGSRFVRVWREAGRLKDGELELCPGERRIWDNRFEIHWSASPPEAAVAESITVRPLGSAAYLQIVERLIPGRRPPAQATYALPAFWKDSDLIAVPALSPFARPGAVSLDRPGFELSFIGRRAAAT